MDYTERRVDDVVILELEGKLWLGESLFDVVNPLLERGETRIVLDMEKITYIDSTGVGDLVNCYRTANEDGASLKLLKLPKRIRELLEIHHLLQIFETHDDEQEVLDSFSGTPRPDLPTGGEGPDRPEAPPAAGPDAGPDAGPAAGPDAEPHDDPT